MWHAWRLIGSHILDTHEHLRVARERRVELGVAIMGTPAKNGLAMVRYRHYAQCIHAWSIVHHKLLHCLKIPQSEEQVFHTNRPGFWKGSCTAPSHLDSWVHKLIGRLVQLGQRAYQIK